MDETPDPLDLSVELLKLLIRIFTDNSKDGRIDFRVRSYTCYVSHEIKNLQSARASREGILFLLRISALQKVQTSVYKFQFDISKVDLALLQNQLEKAAFALNMLHIILGAGFILWGAPQHTAARYVTNQKS
jgi:hypothetical protein